MIIYKLSHLHIESTFGQDEKCLGFFSDYPAVDSAIRAYQKIAGFSEQPTNFIIERVNLPEMGSLNQVFEVNFYIHDEDYSVEFSHSLGVFVCLEEASKVLDAFEKDNKNFIFKAHFLIEKSIDVFDLNVSNWNEGFVCETVEGVEKTGRQK